MSLGVIVQDDVVIDPRDYLRVALSMKYSDVVVAGEVFKGIAPVDYWKDGLRSFALHEFNYEPTLSFFRRSEVGQSEPHYIHHDAMMGDWTAILYLNPEPHPGDGTIFWEHRSSLWGGDVAHMDDARNFTERFRVKAKFNRAVIFPSKWFHSRALFDNYGHGADARLIQVAFGKVA